MRVLGGYLKKNARWIMVDVLCLAAMILVISLNNLPISEWIYGASVCLFLLVVIGGLDFWKYYWRHKRLLKIKEIIPISVDVMGVPADILEEDYQAFVRIINMAKEQEINDLKHSKRDMTEYYTMWIHQIKTPIAAMRLLLQEEESSENRELSEELFRIEQYVEMALQFLRLNADSTDYVIRRLELDDAVREAVRKYARLFIRKKIKLDFQPLHTQVLTDEKWLVFVIEQILSNALKYTVQGSITIYMKENADKVLVIEDTGIGIRSEDLPRVCEKGYTGYNGHADKRSTGIGLYLCKQILNKLGHAIEIESEVGKGTRVMLGLETGEGKTDGTTH